jgi:hypothetical protein
MCTVYTYVNVCAYMMHTYANTKQQRGGTNRSVDPILEMRLGIPGLQQSFARVN